MGRLSKTFLKTVPSASLSSTNDYTLSEDTAPTKVEAELLIKLLSWLDQRFKLDGTLCFQSRGSV